MNTQLPDILTPDQAAAYLQVDRETIYRYIRDGRLGASRIGRSLRIPRRNIDILLLATRARPDLTIRSYSDQQIADFLEADQLDAEAREIVDMYRVEGPVAGPDE
jgi:excisionase family DNA binding protein